METRVLQFEKAERLRNACEQEAGLCNATIEEMNWLQFAWEELDRQMEYDHLLSMGMSDYEARETVWPNNPETPRHPKELNQQPNLKLQNTGFCKHCANAVAWTGDITPTEQKWSHIAGGETPCCNTPEPQMEYQVYTR